MLIHESINLIYAKSIIQKKEVIIPIRQVISKPSSKISIVIYSLINFAVKIIAKKNNAHPKPIKFLFIIEIIDA